MSVFRDNKRRFSSGERTAAPPPSRGVIHIAELAAQAAARNEEPMANTGTVQAHSPVRKSAIPEAALVFSSAMEATGSTRDDVAAALDISLTIVSGWTSGRRSIPSDCVWVFMRRHPDPGAEILYRCASRLDLPRLRRLTGRFVALLSERESEMGA